MIDKLNQEEIENLLHHQIVGHLGCHADGITYIVPVSYAYDGTYIYCHGYEGKKMEMLRKNPKICFQVDEMTDMADWKSVIAWGEFEELKDKNEKNEAFRILLKRALPIHSSITTHLGSQWPFSSDDLGTIEGVAFRIKIKEKTGRFERTGASPILLG